MQLIFDNDDPFIYSKIETTFVHEDHKIFIGRAPAIVRFIEHMKTLEVQDNTQLVLVTYHDFYRSGVLHMKSKHNEHYLIEKDHADVSFLI